jgi:hypothetical protein
MILALFGNDLVYGPCIGLLLAHNLCDLPPTTGQRLALAHQACIELGAALQPGRRASCVRREGRVRRLTSQLARLVVAVVVDVFKRSA